MPEYTEEQKKVVVEAFKEAKGATWASFLITPEERDIARAILKRLNDPNRLDERGEVKRDLKQLYRECFLAGLKTLKEGLGVS